MPEGQEITLRLRETVLVRGIVLLPDGTPSRAQVTSWADSDLVALIHAGPDGRFEVRVPRDGKDIRIGAGWDDRTGEGLRRFTGFTTVADPAGEVTIHLAPVL